MKKNPIILVFILLVILLQTSVTKADISYEKHILPNGLTLLLDEKHEKQIISACLFVDGGLRTENPDVYGISHFIEHLVFRGPTENLEELELRRNFRQWGDFSGYTSDDLTCYGFTVRPEDFDTALDEFVDGVMNLTIPLSVIEKEKSVVTREIHQRRDIPGIRIWELFSNTALETHSYAHPVIGYEKVIENLNEDVVRTWYKEHYAPDQLVLAVTGDFESQKMLSRIEGAFAAFQPVNKDFERGFIDPFQAKALSKIEESDVDTIHMMLGWRVPPIADNTSPALEVLAEILGGNKDSRLSKSLKTEKKLVDEINSFTWLRKDIGFLIVYVKTTEPRIDDIKTAILEEIKNLSQNPPTDSEISMAKKRIENGHSFSLQTYENIAQYIAKWELMGNPDLGQNWLEYLNQTDTDALINLTNQYLQPDKLTCAALIPAKEKSAKQETISEDRIQSSTPLEFNRGEAVSWKLSNGTKVIYESDQSSDIVGIVILAGYGQLLENAGKEGINYLLADMLKCGCGDLDAESFRKKVEDLGCNLNVTADRDYINITMEIHRDRFIEGIELLSSMIFEPLFDPDEFDTVKSDTLAGIERKRESSFEYVNDLFFKSIYGDTPYGYPVEGIKDSIESITIQDVAEFHKVALSPQYLVVSVVGNPAVDNPAVVLDRNLGRLMKNAVQMEEISIDYPVGRIPVPRQGADIRKLPRSQVSFNMGFTGISATDPDYPALRMLVRLLGLRVFDKYVYELGWSYRMWLYMPTRRGPSPVMYEMGVDEVNYENAKQGLIDAMNDVINQPIPDDEVKKVCNYMIQSFTLGMQKNSEIAFNLAFYEKIGIGYEHVQNYEEVYSSITSADLGRVARKYFYPDKMRLSAIIPASENR
jgi:zinc protease